MSKCVFFFLCFFRGEGGGWMDIRGFGVVFAGGDVLVAAAASEVG